MNTSDLIDPSFSYRLISTLLHFLWQGSLVALLAVLGDAFLRRASARRRYTLHVGALLLMIACVAITFLRVAPPPRAPATAQTTAPITPATAPSAPGPDAGSSPDQPSEGALAFGGMDSSPPELPQAASPVASVNPPLGGHELPVGQDNHWPSLQDFAPHIALVYFVGCGVLLARLVRGTWVAHRLRRLAITVSDDSLVAMVHRQSMALGLRVLPRVAWCAEVSVPLVIGILQPLILLPAAAVTGLSPDQLHALITHELAHIRRYDLLMNLVQRIVESLLFFHPAVWYISRRISSEREQACDELVLESGCERLRYADALVRMAELSSSLRRLAASATATSLAASGASSSEFKRRVLKILSDPTTSDLRPSRMGLLGILTLIVGAVVSAPQWHFPLLAETPPQPESTETMPPDGLEFLKPYPGLHGLSLDMTEPQILEIVKRQELKTRKSVDGKAVTHHIALGDGHTLIVMFGEDAKCRGIQRLRSEETPDPEVGARPGDFIATLPDGRSVEFVGITNNTAPAKKGWNPDGTPIGDVGYWPSTIVLHSENTSSAYVENGPHPEPDADAIDLLFRFRGLKEQPSLRFDVATNGESRHLLPLKDPYEVRVSTRRRGEPPVGASWSIPDGEFRIGLTDEPWGKWVQVDPTGDVLNPLVDGDLHRAIYEQIVVTGVAPHDRAPNKRTLVLCLPRDARALFAFEIRGIDNEGQRQSVTDWGSPEGSHSDPSESHWDLSTAEPQPLARYEFRLRPFRDWVTFTGVSVEPGKASDVKINVAAVPRDANDDAVLAARAEEQKSTVVGTVISVEGKPVAGIEVLAFHGGTQLEQEFTTDARGEFRVPRAWRAVDHWLTVVARDGRRRLGWFDFMVHGHSDNGQKAADGSFRLVLLPMSRTVRGRVLDELGRPLAQIPVQITQLDHENNLSSVHWRYQKLGGGALVPGAVTDNEGRFELKLPAHTLAWLGTSHPDWVESRVRVMKENDAVGDTRLVRAAQVAGRVIDARTGKSLAGVTIAARAKKTEIFESSGGEAISDADGKFLIPGLRSGEYTIQLAGNPFKTLTAPALAGFVLKPGEKHSADFALNVGKRLTGRVLDMDTGEPIPDCKVNCTSPAQPNGGLDTQTNPQGEFEFIVPPGSCSLSSTEGRRFGNESTREVEVLEDGDPEPVVLKVGPKTESAPGGFKIFIGLPLDRRVSLHFQRAPLVEVLTAACKAAAITLDLDEDGLKSVGYTKNTPVTIDADKITLRDALAQVLKSCEKLSFTLDKNQLFVSTREQVEAREKKLAQPDPDRDKQTRVLLKSDPITKFGDQLVLSWVHEGDGHRHSGDSVRIAVLKDGTVIAAGDSNRNRECQIQLTATELDRLLKELDEVDHCFDLTPGGDHVIQPGQPYNQWDHGVDWLRIRRGTKEVHVGLVGNWIVGQEEHIPGVSTCREILARLNPLIHLTRAGGWDEIERLLPIANAALKESFPELPPLNIEDFSSSERFRYPARSINFRRTGADGENFGVELEQRDDGTVNPISVWNGGDIRDVEKPLVVRGLDLSKIPFTKEWKEMEKLRVLTDSGYTFKPEYAAYEVAPEVWACYLPGEDKFYIEVGNNQRRRKLYGPVAGNPLRVLNPPPVPTEAGQETATANRQRDLSLADLVRLFNNQNQPERERLNQPELTEEEVSAVIQRDKWLREDPPLNEEEIKAFKAIAVSQRLPEYSHFDLETEDKTETFVWKKFWRVRLMLPAIGRDGHVGLTIRDTRVAEEKIEPQHVAWGTPDAEGLTLGIYLSPKKALYAIGDSVRLRFLVRNNGSQPVETLWPGVSVPMPEDFTVTDATGAKVAVTIGHQNWDSPFTTLVRKGMLGVGDVHGLTVPYEIRIGGDGSADRLIGRVLNVRPGQTLRLKVRERNGSSRERPPGESEPESGSITFTVAEPPQKPAATLPDSGDETPTTGDKKAAPQPDKNAKSNDPRPAQDEVRNLLKPALLLPDHWILQAVAFDRNGCEVITASNQSFITIRRWDLAGRSLISEVKLQADRHGRPVRSGTLKFSGDLRRVIAATDAYVGIWDAVTGQLLKQLPFEAKSGIYDCAIDLLDCTPDLSVIVGHRALPGRLTLSFDAHLIVWDGNTGNVARTIIDKGATDLKSIDLSTDGERLATTNGSGARIWDTRTGQLLRSIPNDNSGRKHSEPDVSSQYTSHVWSVQFSPDGRQVALGDILGVKLFETRSGKQLRLLEGPYRYSSSASPGLVFSPDGEQLARLGTQEKIDGDKHRYVVPIWSTRTGAKQVVLHTEANDAAFSDDGQCFAVGFSDMQQALGVYLLSADEEDARESAGPGPHSRVDRVEENGHYVGAKAAEYIERFQPTWGEARLGLQYGIALTKPGGRFRSGERVPLVVFIRNTSDQPIKFDTAPDFFGNAPLVLNAQGERLTLENIPLLGNIPHYHETLAPGEALGPFYLSIGLGENPRPTQQHWHPILKTPLAGSYTLTHSAMINVPGPKDEAAKKEKIASSTIAFEIVE